MNQLILIGRGGEIEWKTGFLIVHNWRKNLSKVLGLSFHLISSGNSISYSEGKIVVFFVRVEENLFLVARGGVEENFFSLSSTPPRKIK